MLDQRNEMKCRNEAKTILTQLHKFHTLKSRHMYSLCDMSESTLLVSEVYNIGTLCGRDCWWACLASHLTRRSQRTVCGVPECPPLQTWGSFQEGWLRWQSHWQDGCRSYLHEGIKCIQTDISLWQYWLSVACTVYWHGGKHILWVWHYWPVAVLRGGLGGDWSPLKLALPHPLGLCLDNTKFH